MNCFEQDIKLRAHWEQVITYVVLEQNLISPYRPWTASLANIQDWLTYFTEKWYLQSCARDFPSHVEPVLWTPGCWCWWWCGAQWTEIVKISISRLSESSCDFDNILTSHIFIVPLITLLMMTTLLLYSYSILFLGTYPSDARIDKYGNWKLNKILVLTDFIARFWRWKNFILFWNSNEKILFVLFQLQFNT